MYKVLDQDGNRITVPEVDKDIHLHISGRKFTSEDNVKFKTVAKKTIEKITIKKETKQTTKPLVSKSKK